MKAKLIINGKEIEVEISDEQAKALTEKPKEKTGYERLKIGDTYFLIGEFGDIGTSLEDDDYYDKKRYDAANYYSDEVVAENNARADKLYRQLRRFAVEHRIKNLDWADADVDKVHLFYNHPHNRIEFATLFTRHEFGNIFFDSNETAQLAIDTFKDELIWYFTEYKDSLQ